MSGLESLQIQIVFLPVLSFVNIVILNSEGDSIKVMPQYLSLLMGKFGPVTLELQRQTLP